MEMLNSLRENLKIKNFNFIDINDEVLIIEDFLSKKEIDTIIKIIDKTPEEQWFIEYTENLKRFCMEKFGRDDVENLVAEGKYEITANWEDKNLNISYHPLYRSIHTRLNSVIEKSNPDLELSGFATIQRMQEGVELKSHTDQHTDPSIRYASILYLNDNYKDGELYFKNLNIELKPKPGSLLIFPGTSQYEHGVKHVGAGPIRYVLVGFVKVKNFYVNNKY
jgi:hypothetical protein